MAAAINLTPAAGTDGIPYTTAVPLTATEADLGDALLSPRPIPVEYGQVIVAVVKLTITGIVAGNNTYVVMQTDLGDGTWIDMAWIVWTGNQGAATFVLSGGLGTMTNAFQQTRSEGQPPTPQTTGANALPIGGRVRFVGKSAFVGGSSSLSGVPTAVKATITYKLLTPR